ncbi:SCO2521 family protein [Sphaerimonospora sp. CA-214678]|uniref:SCO2521 family protein n=1 Tax=Sphaerimonospora sp. CA-214678 TaxID=3240029 RepID=UPI003D8D7B91
MGEVHTGLLQNSGEVTASACDRLLGLLAGQTVRVSRRPIVHAMSPDRLTGVDCHLPSASRSRVRGVGTVLTRCSITGGRVVQGSSYVRIVRATVDRRLPWSHYLARPGVVEVLGKAKAHDLADGFTDEADGHDGMPARRDSPGSPLLDLGAISGRFVDLVQSSPLLDRRAPFKIPRTRLRWVAESGEQGIRFTLRNDRSRTLRLVHGGGFTPSVADLCEDLALHDWLLTTLLVIVERALTGGAPRSEAVARLTPAVDHLLHLWMPAARVDQAFAPLWESLERHPGFTRQWRSLVNRVRDQISMDILTLLTRRGGW